tara:strand:+ start:759 stop:1334 length:576 start_codon:yes stop_codon:yes gene_type:complete
MAAFKKFFKDIKNEHILGIIGLVFLVFALHQYSHNKNIFQLGMTPMSPAPYVTNTPNNNPSQPTQSILGASSSNTYAPYNGAPQPPSQTQSNSSTPPVTMNKPASNPLDLLPSDSNNSWSNMNPTSSLQNIHLLNPQQQVGINTQGTSLRNANLQLRSEPPNPLTNTNCPWNISTIEADKFRRPLEIGSSS